MDSWLCVMILFPNYHRLKWWKNIKWQCEFSGSAPWTALCTDPFQPAPPGLQTFLWLYWYVAYIVIWNKIIRNDNNLKTHFWPGKSTSLSLFFLQAFYYTACTNVHQPLILNSPMHADVSVRDSDGLLSCSNISYTSQQNKQYGSISSRAAHCLSASITTYWQLKKNKRCSPYCYFCFTTHSTSSHGSPGGNSCTTSALYKLTEVNYV